MPDTSLQKSIGQQIRKLRLARGLTLREAAEICGLSHQMLGQIENGTNTTLDRIDGIVRGLQGHTTIMLQSQEQLASEPAPRSDESVRWAAAQRLMRVLPFLPDDHLDVFLHELVLWERRYVPPEKL